MFTAEDYPAGAIFYWRRVRDSNPRSPRGDNAFRVRPVRPLRQLSCGLFLITGEHNWLAAGRGFYTLYSEYAQDSAQKRLSFTAVDNRIAHNLCR